MYGTGVGGDAIGSKSAQCTARDSNVCFYGDTCD